MHIAAIRAKPYYLSVHYRGEIKHDSEQLNKFAIDVKWFVSNFI